ncbi:MAG: M56 family metallopeptidase [Saprospiraceae bacterium]|nr:M56 family metallopeptidase [Saprospiraceae bacterium]
MITQLVLYPALIWGLSALYFQIFLRAEKQFTYNRLFLLLSLVTGLIIPFLNSSQFLQFIKTSDSVFYVITSPEILITSSISKITENNQIYGDIFLTIYLFVAIIFVVRLLKSLYSIYILYVNSIKEHNPDYTLIHTSINPFSFLNFVFINERDKEQYDKILDHELVHVRHYHSIDIIFIEILKIVFWFNPIIYLFSKYIRENHEFTADNEVISHFPKKTYSEILIRQLQSGMQFQVTNNFFNSLIKTRIKMMYKSKNQNRWKYIMAVTFGLLLVFFARSLQSQTDIRADKKANKSVATENVFDVVDEMPRFPGCEDKMTKEEKENCSIENLMNYVAKNLKYPEAAVAGKIEGKVVAKFTVSKKGMVKNIQIIKDIEYGCGNEVKRILESMNSMPQKWIPGKNKGKNVDVFMTLPVMFKLSDKKK